MSKRIAVITYTHLSFGRDIVRGLLRYRNQHQPDWRVQVVWRSIEEAGLNELLAPFDMVVNAWSDDEAGRIEKPNIRISCDSDACRGFVIDNDELAVGRLAAVHLIERKPKSYVSVQRDHVAVSRRLEAFNVFIREHGHEPLTFKFHDSGLFENPDLPADSPLHQLTDLPKPIGLFCDTDNVAITLLQGLEQLGLTVPDDVLLLGVDNDQFVCELAWPMITSVAIPYDRMGFIGGEMIAAYFKKGRWPARPKPVAPLGVVARGSTEQVVREDDLVAGAIRFIRDRAVRPGGLRVTDVADHLTTSVRTLQNRFKDATGRTVLQEITRRRVARADELLRDQDIPLKEVARRAGFSSASKFCDVFKRTNGMTPMQMRRGRL